MLEEEVQLCLIKNTILITQPVLLCRVGRNDMANGKPQTTIDRSRVINSVDLFIL